MDKETPEAALDALQKELDAVLGYRAPRLGTHPDRVKSYAMFVFMGAVIFGGVSHYTNGDGEVVGGMGMAGFVAMIVCAVVAFGYERHWWKTVEQARVLQRELEAEREGAS